MVPKALKRAMKNNKYNEKHPSNATKCECTLTGSLNLGKYIQIRKKILISLHLKFNPFQPGGRFEVRTYLVPLHLASYLAPVASPNACPSPRKKNF